MDLLKKGMTGTPVSELQQRLQELSYNVAVTGIFDTVTDNAVKHYQASHLDKHGQPLVVDGKVGELTWWALNNPRPKVTGGAIDYTQMPAASLGGASLGRAALQIAINELVAGAGEVGGDNKGPWVKKYLQPAGLSEGEPWCAAFVSWCFLQAVGGDKTKMPFKYTAGARDIYNQFKAKGWHFNGADPANLPKPGDIVAWWRISMPSGKGHIGIVHHVQDGFIYTIEGNKAANVAGFSYVRTRMEKLLGFGRVQ